ncbi:MAG: hypothetical protein ACTSX6_09995 [Candidatus Heimdallarchaeaceae archaeon]
MSVDVKLSAEQMLKKYSVYINEDWASIRNRITNKLVHFDNFIELLEYLRKRNITNKELYFPISEDRISFNEQKERYMLKTCFKCAKQQYILKEQIATDIYYCDKCDKELQELEKRRLLRSDYTFIKEQQEAVEDYEKLAIELLGEDEVKLQGFLLNVSMPSEARLSQRLSSTQLKELKKLANNARVSDVSFSFFSNEYSSRIKSIRRDLYTKIISKYCIKIQHIDNKTLYLLPGKNVPSFIQKIEELNKELKELKKDIEEEQGRLNNNERLQHILKEYNITIKQVDTSGFRIYYKLDPIKLDSSTIREILEEDLNLQLSLKGEKIIKEYEQQLREQNEAILNSLEEEFISKLKLLITKLGRKIAGEKVHTKVLDAELQLLENKSRSVGLSHLANLTKTTRIFLEQIAENKQSSLRACAQEISRLVRIPKAEYPKVTIRHGLNKLNNIADARILSLQRKLEEMS